MCSGGAPRDWYLGIAAQDLDFYIRLPSEYEDSLAVKLKLLTGLDFQSITKDKELEQKIRKLSICSFCLGRYLARVQNQLVVIYQQYSPEYIHELFPFDICQAKYTSGRGIQGTENFFQCCQK